MVAQKPFLIHSQVPASVTALPRLTLVGSAVEALRQRILSGACAEGEALNQVAIAREFAISRIPLREAMRQLEAEGLLVFQPGKGAVVSGLSLREVREVIQLRARLEPELLSEAIPKLREQDLEEASEILDQFDEALKEHNVAVWGELNWRFHSTLCAPSGRVLTMGIVQTLHNLNQRYARVQISGAKWEARAAKEHRALLSACRKQERHKAANLLKAHILTAGESLIQLLERSRGTKPIAEAQ